MLDILKDQQIIKRVPFPVDVYFKEYNDENDPRKHPFCEGFLVSVEAETRVSKEYTLLEDIVLEEGVRPTPEQVTDESKRFILVFTFEDQGGNYHHSEEFWDGDMDTHKFQTALSIGLRKVAQIMAAYVGETNTHLLLGSEGLTKVNPNYKTNFKTYWEAYAHQFNTGRNGKPVFLSEDKKIPVRFKLVRQARGKRANSLQLSSNGNCIERISSNKKSILTVMGNDSFETISKPKGKLPITASNASPIGGGSDDGDWPDV